VVKTPEELVWGYEEPLFEAGRMVLPNPPLMNKFGFFTGVSKHLSPIQRPKFNGKWTISIKYSLITSLVI